MQTSGVDEVHCAPESWCVCLLYHKLQRRAESWGWQPLLLDGHGCESFCFGATSDPISQLRRLRQRGQAPCLRSHSSGKARNTSQAVWFRIRMEGLSLPMPGESRKGAMTKLQPFRRSVVHPGQELHHLLWQLQWGAHSPPVPRNSFLMTVSSFPASMDGIITFRNLFHQLLFIFLGRVLSIQTPFKKHSPLRVLRSHTLEMIYNHGTINLGSERALNMLILP